MKTPRRLRELHQRAHRLVEQRIRQGATPLDITGLALALNCKPEQVQEAKAVHRALQLRSLDAPLPGSDQSSGEARCLVDQIAAPGSMPDPVEATRRRQLGWLNQQLRALAPLDQALLHDHWILGRSWKELGLQLRMKPKDIHRRAEAALEQLRQNLPREAL